MFFLHFFRFQKKWRAEPAVTAVKVCKPSKPRSRGRLIVHDRISRFHVLPFPASRAHRSPFVHPLVGGSAPNSHSFRPCRACNKNTNGRANARPPVFESNLSESRFSLLLPQQVFIQRQRLCMHLFGHGLAGFGRGGLFGLRRIGGGRRSPRPPENSAHMLHMLHVHHIPKAYDVFLQKPSGVLPENVEIVGIGIDFCLSGLVRLPQNPFVHKDRHHF